jgi:hypothetical protein
MTAARTPSAWLAALEGALDRLERALLEDEATAVEDAARDVHALLCETPWTVADGDADELPTARLSAAARRLARLHEALRRRGARHQRALETLLPPPPTATYGDRGTGAVTGRAYHLSA